MTLGTFKANINTTNVNTVKFLNVGVIWTIDFCSNFKISRPMIASVPVSSKELESRYLTLHIWLFGFPLYHGR